MIQDRMKSFADKRRIDLEFDIGDMVFVTTQISQSRKARIALRTIHIRTQIEEHFIADFNNYIRVQECNRV